MWANTLINHDHLLGKFTRRQTDDIFFFIIIFPENRFWPFLQIVSFRANLHERSKPIFRKKKKKIKMLSAEIFTQHAKH